MHICTSFCLLPSSVRRKGRILEVDGPFGMVEVESFRANLSYYRGSRLKNGSIRTYVRHIVSELRRLFARPISWGHRNGRCRITDPDRFYEESFLPWSRERDLMERWRAENQEG